MFCHEVMMKFEEGYLNEETLRNAREKAKAIQEKLDFTSEVRIVCNCVERDINYDMLLQAVMDDASNLPVYLSDPVHQSLWNDLKAHVVAKAAIDYIR